MKTLVQILCVLCVLLLSSCAALSDLISGIGTGSSGSQNSGSGGQGTALPSQRDMDAKHWDMAALDTARGVSYLSETEKDVILEMNKARTDPAKYAKLYLEPRRRYFAGKTYRAPGQQIATATTEGVSALNECIAYMQDAAPLPVLMPAEGLSAAARDHAVSQGKTDQTGHTGTDGSSPFDRIDRYGTYRTAGENIAYGPSSGKEIVIQLMIDDGVPNRGHRVNIMHKDFTSSGCAYYPAHKKYGTVCVITYAGGYKDT